jgi:toxin ParE1/3/4
MVKYKLTNKAVNDLTQIWNYTFDKWSESQADKYYQMLIDNFNEVANNPYLGKHYSGVMESLMGIRSGRHIIFYRKIEEDRVEIIRILHEEMDLKSRIIEK